MPVLNTKELRKVTIGHSIISRAFFVGLSAAVDEMPAILEEPFERVA